MRNLQVFLQLEIFQEVVAIFMLVLSYSISGLFYDSLCFASSEPIIYLTASKKSRFIGILRMVD